VDIVLTVVIVVLVVGVLDSDGGVRDVEFFLQHELSHLEDSHGPRSLHVAGQGNSVAGNSPNMEVVDITLALISAKIFFVGTAFTLLFNDFF